MEVKDVNFKRFIASNGKALKWSEYCWNCLDNTWEISNRGSYKEAVIDLNSLVGEVCEIPIEIFEKEAKQCF